MPYQIITDSACDFPTPMYEQLNLTMLPLTITFRGVSADDRNDDSLKEVYDGLRNGEVATTAAVNPQSWDGAMRPHLQNGKDVLVLAFSSGLSTTYQSAVIAAEELKEEFPERKIIVVDTLCASLGQGLLVWYACKLRDQGKSLEEVSAWVEENKFHLCHWFTVDDLHFLKRGGRISAATAVVGTMLAIKPVLHVDNEGHLINMAKARGRSGSLKALVDHMAQTATHPEDQVVFISHGDCLEDARKVGDMIQQRLGVRKVMYNTIGPVIGAHAGPGTVALFFLGTER